jgi:hypothetical protein
MLLRSVFAVSCRRSFPVSIRSVCTSAAAALGIACSSGAFARTVFVHAAYVPTTIVYVPPVPVHAPGQTPLYAPTPAYAVPSVVLVAPVLQKPLPDGAVAIPLPVGGVGIGAANANTPGYAVVPAQNIAYAQPVLAVPRTAAH